MGLVAAHDAHPGELERLGHLGIHDDAGFGIPGNNYLEFLAGSPAVLQDVIGIHPHHIVAVGKRDGIVLRGAEVENAFLVMELAADLIDDEAWVRMFCTPLLHQFDRTVGGTGVNNDIFVSHGKKGIETLDDAPLAIPDNYAGTECSHSLIPLRYRCHR